MVEYIRIKREIAQCEEFKKIFGYYPPKYTELLNELEMITYDR